MDSAGLAWDRRDLAAAERLYAARIDRVRVVAWSGDFPAALHELDAILKESPTETGAMELRAQVAAWGRDFDDAIGIYNALLGIVAAHGDANRAHWTRILTACHPA